MSLSLSIIIPAYNEEANIGPVVKESYEALKNLTSDFDIVVVDDCSSDNTQNVLKELQTSIPQLKVIRNEKNIGCHPCTLIGFQAAQGEYQYFIPADLQIPAHEITRFLAKAQQGHDIVYSWRKKRADPTHRLWVSQFYNFLVRHLFGIPVHDVDSSSMLSKKAVKTIIPFVNPQTTFIAVEILLQARRAGLSIGEVEISHRPRIAGEAKGLDLYHLSKIPFGIMKYMLSYYGDTNKRK